MKCNKEQRKGLCVVSIIIGILLIGWYSGLISPPLGGMFSREYNQQILSKGPCVYCGDIPDGYVDSNYEFQEVDGCYVASRHFRSIDCREANTPELVKQCEGRFTSEDPNAVVYFESLICDPCPDPSTRLYNPNSVIFEFPEIRDTRRISKGLSGSEIGSQVCDSNTMKIYECADTGEAPYYRDPIYNWIDTDQSCSTPGKITPLPTTTTTLRPGVTTTTIPTVDLDVRGIDVSLIILILAIILGGYILSRTKR